MKRSLVIGVLLVIAVAAGVGFFYPFARSASLRLSGIVEIQEVHLGSKVGGRVAKVLVNEGDIVTAGTKLVVIEEPELETQRDQFRAKLEAAQAQLNKVKGPVRDEEEKAAKAVAKAAQARYDRMIYGWRPEEKKQAESDLDAAQAQLSQADLELSRMRELYDNKSASKAELDSAIGNRDRALGRRDSAKAKDEMYKIGNREEDIAEALAQRDEAQSKYEQLKNSRADDIALAKASVDELAAKLREIDVNLEEAVVRVPQELHKVSVEVVAVRPGDIVAAGQPVVRVLREDDMWVKVFIPETQYGLISVGQEAYVTMDARPNKVFKGLITQANQESEFTPRNVQSIDERHHQVFGVKIRILDPEGEYHQGMAAEVTIPIQHLD